jgi:hypothetical protein
MLRTANGFQIATRRWPQHQDDAQHDEERDQLLAARKILYGKQTAGDLSRQPFVAV